MTGPAIISALLALTLPALSLGSQATRFARVEKLILDQIASGSPPGLAIAVAHGDSIIWEAGFGLANSEKKIPATVHTPFYLASVTKSIVATAAMVLQQRGRLNLDRSVNDYLGKAKLWSPRWDAGGVTVRQLVTHTAGLSTFDASCDPARRDCRDPGLDELIARYGVLVWPAGEHFDYSNLGYHVLAEIVARAAGRDLAGFLRDEVFQPLGMEDASLGVDAKRLAETAVPHSWSRGALSLESGATSSSTIHASAHDLVLFGMMHAKVRRVGSRALVSEAAIDSMHLSFAATDGTGQYNFGWSIEENRFGYRSLLSQGGTDAAQAWLRIIPSERIVVAVVANKGVSQEGVVDAVLGELLPRYAAQQAAQANATPAPAATVVSVDSMFTGTWRGAVRTETGELPLDIEISNAGVARATVGQTVEERGGRARMGTRLFVVRIPGGLDTPDSTSGRQLALYLKLRDGVFNGVLTTAPPLASGLVGRVSYWVELRRRR